MIFFSRLAIGIFVLLFFALAGMYIYWFGTMLWTKGVPTINTFRRQYTLLKQLEIAPGASLIDLGCGTGHALRFFADHFDKLKLTGVDLNRLAIKRGQWQNKKPTYAAISLRYDNIFNTDIASYDYVYIYLLPTIMPEVEEYLSQHLAKDGIVICNSFPLPTWKPYQEIDDTEGTPKIFLYKKPR